MKDFTYIQFKKFSELIYDNLGVYYNDDKSEVLHTKLNKLMRRLDIQNYDEYYQFLLNDNKKANWTMFVDEITTHKTDFFREQDHFTYIKDQIRDILKNNPRISDNNEIRVWSSACSSGEEAYTLAFVLKETLPYYIDIKILATDVSSKVILDAQSGIYPQDIEKDIKPEYLHQYFKKSGNEYKIIPEIKKLITFRTFNLMNYFPFRHNFDIIFCRNVMIYFDFITQEQLIKKFYNVLNDGGLLFIGHSENLTKKQGKFKYVRPAVYLK